MKWSGINADAITNSKLDEQATIDQYGVKIESKSTQIDIVALIFLIYTYTLRYSVMKKSIAMIERYPLRIVR